MYHLTLTENQTRIRVLLQHLSQARRDPRRWLRLADVESVLERTNDPESYRSLLLASTHLEDVIESDTRISYPLWSAMRLPYVITNGPGRKCTAAELVDAPVWNNELNWMDVLGHLSKLIPAVRECATGGNLDRVERVNARLTTELTPLLFEMNAVAPVLVGEVERLLNAGTEDTIDESASNAKASQQQEISQAEVAQAQSQATEQQGTESTNAESGTQKDRVARKTKSANTASTPKVSAAKKAKAAKTVTTAKKKSAAAKKVTPSSKSAPKRKKTATAESERRALAVGIADADAANDQYAHQLALPLFG